ncbi:hypothetical protein GCM10022256_15950 [Frondihabitans peucedani]|uniref:Uncharacterized protein n=1 Tax=Frondihabitans peucedani TaxID=598626 RepID=A0ABP8E1B1_9MICO
MGMQNCVKWTLRGVSYEVCDFGTSLIAHLPSATGGEAKTIHVGTDTTWAFEGLSRRWSDEATLSIDEADRSKVTVPLPSTMGRVLERWLTRVAKREHASKPPA